MRICLTGFYVGTVFSFYKLGKLCCIMSLYDTEIWSYVKYYRYWIQYLLDFVFNWFHYLGDFYVCLTDSRTLTPLPCKLGIYGRQIIKETCLNQREISLDFLKNISVTGRLCHFLTLFYYPLLSSFSVFTLGKL